MIVSYGADSQKTCCFTGHRKIPVNETEKIKDRLAHVITSLYAKGICNFGAGGALGFDTLAAQAVLKLRDKHPAIKLILVLPCYMQTRRWQPDAIKTYEQIKQAADQVVYTSQEYTRDCMYKRNRYLVDHSSICVCYMTSGKGGTAYTVKYANQHHLPIINLADPIQYSPSCITLY